MFCHFDMTLGKALGLSRQIQQFLGEPRQSPVYEVTEIVPVGEVMSGFPAGGAGGRQPMVFFRGAD